MSDSIRIIKRKVTGFFKPGDVQTIRSAIQDVDRIITDTSVLIRAYYLYCLDSSPEAITVNRQLLDLASSIIQGAEKPQLRGERKNDENLIAIFNQLKNVKIDVFGDAVVDSKHSLSQILNYSLENLITAYENNISSHFIKYPKKVITMRLIDQNIEKKDARRIAAIVSNHLFYDVPITSDIQGVDPIAFADLFPDKQMIQNQINEQKRKAEELKAIKEIEKKKKEEEESNKNKKEKETKKEKKDKKKKKPVMIEETIVDVEVIETLKPHCYYIEVNPWVYLRKMVEMNKTLETYEGHKLLNPLPFHSSNIPMHIRIDTSGLAQLLMTKDKIEDFKKQYALEYNDELNINNKADLLSSFEKLHGYIAFSRRDEGEYATSIWSFLTNLKSCKQWKELKGAYDGEKVFDNAVVTDGVSISFQVISIKAFGRKTFGAKAKKTEKKEKETIIPPTIDLKTDKVISCDPGKKDILAMTDGIKSLTYTRGQRSHDCHLFAKTKETLKKRKRNALDVFESTVLNQTCKKSCTYSTFREYCKSKLSRKQDISKVYSNPMFRQFKFLTYCKTKSSEKKFMNQVKKTFGPSNNPNHHTICLKHEEIANASKSQDNLTIAWGNWGKNPNALKNGAPTPGIGIRRRFEKEFKVVVTCEHLTSQNCPCCGSQRSLKKPSLNGLVRHHLLRCENVNCMSRWWNRNVAGSLNILFRALGTERTPENEALGTSLGRASPEPST